MKKKTFNTIFSALEDEASRDSLVDLMENWGVTIDDYHEFEELLNKLSKTLEE